MLLTSIQRGRSHPCLRHTFSRRCTSLENGGLRIRSVHAFANESGAWSISQGHRRFSMVRPPLLGCLPHEWEQLPDCGRVLRHQRQKPVPVRNVEDLNRGRKGDWQARSREREARGQPDSPICRPYPRPPTSSRPLAGCQMPPDAARCRQMPSDAARCRHSARIHQMREVCRAERRVGVQLEWV